MDKPQMKTEIDPTDTSTEMESETSHDDISQQDQNAQLFIEALLQASQNQLLTESAVLAMNQLWMGSRGALAQSGQGNISLAGPGNVSLVTPGNLSVTVPSNISLTGPGSGNVSVMDSRSFQVSADGILVPKNEESALVQDRGNVVLDNHRNFPASSHDNLQIGDHANIQSDGQSNEKLGHVTNTTQAGQIHILQPGVVNAIQLTNLHSFQREHSDFQKEAQIPVKDSHIKQALAAPLRISRMGNVIVSSDNHVKVIASGDSGVKARELGSKVSEAKSLSSIDQGDTVESDCSVSDGLETGKQSFVAKTELYADTVVDLMDTSCETVSEGQPDLANISSSTVQATNQNIRKSTSPPASSIKKKSRRQSSSTNDGNTTPSGGARSQLAQEKSGGDTGNRATTPRRRGSHLSEGGRRSRPLSECEGDVTPDATSHLSGYSSEELHRQMTGSVTPDTDVGFQPSMLEAVLTEKKLALLRSPEVRQFLQQQQMQRARERKVTHSSRGSCSKGDNST